MSGFLFGKQFRSSYSIYGDFETWTKKQILKTRQVGGSWNNNGSFSFWIHKPGNLTFRISTLSKASAIIPGTHPENLRIWSVEEYLSSFWKRCAVTKAFHSTAEWKLNYMNAVVWCEFGLHKTEGLANLSRQRPGKNSQNHHHGSKCQTQIAKKFTLSNAQNRFLCFVQLKLFTSLS